MSDVASGDRGELIVKSIFMTHVRRIGWLRTALGGGLMYLSVFEFVFIHLSSIVVLYQWLMRPFFGAKSFAMRDYILLDRGRIEHMRAFDRFNCQFCGYANGTAKLWNDQLDAIAAAPLGSGKFLRKAVAGAYALLIGVFLALNFAFSKLLFGLISLFLGYHRADVKGVYAGIVASSFAEGHGPALRTLLRWTKLYAATLAMNLEQIESSWCPLKHVETATSVVPEHHARFLPRDGAQDAVRVLERDGTVSTRKPKY